MLKDYANFIHVKQGYAKCNICPVTERAFITSDKGIATVCAKFGFDVLLIESGFIQLEGFDTGFIGGASFKISQSEMAFTGSLNLHPSKAQIEAFLNRYGVKPIYLTEQEIFDIGSAFLIS